MAQTLLAVKVLKVEGEAFVRQSDGSLRPVKAGEVLGENDVLVTQSGSVHVESPSGGVLFVPPHRSFAVAEVSTPDLEGLLDAGNSQTPEHAGTSEETETSSSYNMGGFGAFQAPRVDYLQDMRYFDQGNLGRDVNAVFKFSARHTANPRIAYEFDLDRVKFPLYGVEIDYPQAGRPDSYLPTPRDQFTDVPPATPSPAPGPRPQPDPDPQPQPQPQPGPQPDPAPQPGPEPQPGPQPGPQPDPGTPGGPGGPTPPPPGPNTPPTAQPDANTVSEDGPPVTGSVITNDSDPDGDALTVVGVVAGTQPSASGGMGGGVPGTYGTILCF